MQDFHHFKRNQILLPLPLQLPLIIITEFKLYRYCEKRADVCIINIR